MLVGAGLLVLALGIGLGLWIGSIGRGKEIAKTAEAKAELENYRREVSEHFKTTAVHFESIGAEYRRLYEHMAAGAGSLCEMRAEIFDTPVEQIAVRHFDEDAIAAPPRDYEAVADEDTEEAEEVVEAVEAVEAVEISPAEEPTDEELAETESSEELLADRDITPEPKESEKTLH